MSENMELETKDIVTSSDAENEAAADTADNAKEKEIAPKDNNVSDESFSKKIGNKILIAALAVYAFVISVVGIVSYLSPEKAQEEDILNLIQLGQYKDLNVSVEKATVTDEEINEQIESLVTNSG